MEVFDGWPGMAGVEPAGPMVRPVLGSLEGAPVEQVAISDPTAAAEFLDATAGTVDQWTMQERITFLRGLHARAAPLGADGRWHMVEGVLTFLNSRGLGCPGTWMSWVNAGVLEAIQGGIAVALKVTDDDLGNAATRRWADYLDHLSEGRLSLPSQHAHMWSMAGEAAIDAGLHLAEDVHGLRPTAVERDFLRYAQAYIWSMRNRPAAEMALSMASAFVRELTVPPGFLDWFLGTGDPSAARAGCEIAWALACRQHVRGPSGPLGSLGCLLTHLPRLLTVYETRRHEV